MLSLFRRDRRTAAVAALYEAIVAQSRRPEFYTGYAVPDTIEGRFDMIVLHLSLLCQRLGREADAGRVLGQGVFDRFCKDMDDNLREMGVGDLSVPKRMMGFAEAFYGRVDVYDRALRAPDGTDLADAVSRNVFGKNEIQAGARRLAAYMRIAAARLDAQSADDFNQGHVTYPDPNSVAAGNEVRS